MSTSETPLVPPSQVETPPEYDLVNIFSFSTNIPLATIPLSLIQSSGLNCWHFLISILRMLEAVDLHALCEIWTSSGKLDNPSLPVLPGSYTLKQPGLIYNGRPLQDLVLVPRIPQLLFGPSPTSGESWFEYLEQDTDEFIFCQSLVVRDQNCLVTSAPWDICIPTHIVPLNRPDIYQRVLGFYSPPDLRHRLHMSMGVLLSPELSRTFESFEWSLLSHQGYYYIHFFDACHPLRPLYHGNRFGIKRFASHYTKDQSYAWELPDARLLAWHYQQGVQVFADAAKQIPGQDLKIEGRARLDSNELWLILI